MKMLKNILRAAVIYIMFANTVFAAAQAWKIIPENSKIVFTAIQNGAQVLGKFSKFKGTINFDPAQLNESKVNIIVDMNSLSTSYNDLTDTLKNAEWFNLKVFPEAVFNAEKFTKTGDNQYEATGTLTIRDKSEPVTLVFTMEQPTADTAVVKGSTTLRRTAFGIGQGEWSSVTEVQDYVKVIFTVNATKTQQSPLPSLQH